eukprot:5177617-Amphidinium_carterae.1
MHARSVHDPHATSSHAKYHLTSSLSGRSGRNTDCSDGMQDAQERSHNYMLMYFMSWSYTGSVKKLCDCRTLRSPYPVSNDVDVKGPRPDNLPPTMHTRQTLITNAACP